MHLLEKIEALKNSKEDRIIVHNDREIDILISYTPYTIKCLNKALCVTFLIQH